MHVHILTKVWHQKQGDWNTHCVTQWHPCFHIAMQGGWSWHGKSNRLKYMYWCMYTFLPRCVNRKEVTGTHTQCHTGIPMFPWNYAKGVQLTWEVRWMDINSSTHAKGGVGLEVGWLEQTHSATQWHPCFHLTMQRGWSRHGQSGGHVYMYWCMYTF